MMQHPKYREEVNKILARLEEDNNQDQAPKNETSEPIQDVYFIFLRENPDLAEPTVIDSIPAETEPNTDRPYAPTRQAPTPEQEQDEKNSQYVGILMMSFFMLLALSSIVFQVNLILNPPITTITISPKSQTISLSGSLQLGRLIAPITLSQERSVPTTGHGHQDARSATGTVTFYNGLFTQQYIAQGTVYTGSDGVQIVTLQDATIPPGNPSTGYGTATVPAQAEQSGTSGNITAGDINITINNGLLVRNNQFSGGQDERNFQTVTKNDIDGVAETLKTSLIQSMTGVLQGQLKQGEQLQPFPCNPTVTPDHQIGQETTQVKVTVSLTCSGIAYNSQDLESKVMQLLTNQAIKKLGTGYGLLGDVQVTVNQAKVTGSHPTLAFSCTGVWVYAVSDAAQEHIKMLIAGKTKQEAMHVLLSQPGISKVSIQWSDDTKLPKDPRNIHIVLIYGLV